MQNIKNLVNDFGAIHVGNLHADFQASSFTGIGGGGGDGGKDRQAKDTHTISLTSPSLR